MDFNGFVLSINLIAVFFFPTQTYFHVLAYVFVLILQF